MKITTRTTLEQLAAIVSEALNKHGVTAVLTGGAVVSFYTENEYKSDDLDFISPSDARFIEKAMVSIGFSKMQGKKDYTHAGTKYFVEFPPGPLMVGDRLIREKETARIDTPLGKIQLLTPTQCVMDRLAGFYYFNDKQCLDQAVMVARAHGIDWKAVEAWSAEKVQLEKFQDFRSKAQL